MKILVIDDTAANQQSARETLVGHDVKIVSNAEASKLVSDVNHNDFDFDVVLTDLNMPSGINDNKMGAFGYPIALSALMCPKVKCVGLFTNAGAHGDLLSSCSFAKYRIQNMGEKRFLALGLSPEDWGGVMFQNGGKHWGRLLTLLIDHPVNEQIYWPDIVKMDLK